MDTTKNTVTGGSKFDGGKPPAALIPPRAALEVAAVLGFGASKYGAHNWRQGISTNRLMSAALRHQLAFLAGEDTDPESGLSHLAHAACGLLMLIETLTAHPELDDRASASPEVTSRA